MEKLFFGPAGIPLSTKGISTQAGVARVAELKLGCMEIEFVQGVRMNEKGALLVAETATQNKIALSAHAPYFINLNAREPEKIKASQERIKQTAHIASLCGAESIVFHAAFYLDDPQTEVYTRVKDRLEEITKELRAKGNPVWVRPEVTGKPTQFGTLEEVINLSAEIEGVAPCIDFAHWYARTGAFNSYPEFVSILEIIEKRLGRKALDNMHIHVSGIHYGKKGEIRHLNLKESDFKYMELVKAIKDYKVQGIIISESPNLEEDAILLQEIYNSLP